MAQEGFFDPGAYLDAAGKAPDEEIDLAKTALALAILERPGISPGPYFHHLERLGRETAERHFLLLEGGAADDTMTQLAALKHVLSDAHGYAGDVRDRSDPQNADMIRTIDRAMGSPVTLSILYIHAARAQGWSIAGLNVPGHFVCRLEKQGQRVIFDPFEACRVLGAADMRLFVKKALGPQAELLAAYSEPSGNREILLRLQNNLKIFQIEMEDYEAALKTVSVMRRFAPQDYRLLLDAGILFARTGQPAAAIEVLGRYVKEAPDPSDRRDAELLLRQLNETLN